VRKTKEEYLAIIDDIEAIRSLNNKNWMDLLRLSFELDPPAAAEIVAKIYEHDSEISSLARKLTE